MASPVYFYAINAQVKTVIDRTVCQWRDLKNKEFYFIMTATAADREAFDGPLECLRRYAHFFANSKEMGIIYGGGVASPGAVKETSYMEEAYTMGKNI